MVAVSVRSAHNPENATAKAPGCPAEDALACRATHVQLPAATHGHPGGAGGFLRSIAGRPTGRRSRRSDTVRPAAVLVGRGGVEPPTFHFSGGRSYRLSYLPERPKLYNSGMPEDESARPMASLLQASRTT